jgi:Fusaric acid resistance protein family
LIRSVATLLDWCFAFFARELAPSQRRIVEAARTAVKSTLTTGLATAMQVMGPFGPLFAFRIGQPGISLGLREGALTIALAAAMQAAIVPITGKLLDYPGLIMAFLFVVFWTIAYFLSHTQLFMIFALAAVGTISTLYQAIFEPGLIGWGSAYTFDGILVATLVMVSVDTLIWPSSPEARLLESIAADLERARQRLRLVGQRYLDLSDEPLAPPLVRSTLAPNLALLESVKEKTKPNAERLAVLLDAVMTAERVYLEVERLAVLGREGLPSELRQNNEGRIRSAVDAVDNALGERTQDIAEGLAGKEMPPHELGELNRPRTWPGVLDASLLDVDDQAAGIESSNLLGFVDGLQKIATLLEPRSEFRDAGAGEAVPDGGGVETLPFLDPVAFRFAVKLGATITLGLLVGLATQRADLQTILWSVIVAGSPNTYGAVARKTLLRLSGCILGGLATLAAMLVVSQHFDALAAYLAAIFFVAFFSTYLAQSSEWLGYTGVQAGITFIICYVGAAPATDVYKPLWRLWGIVLGVLTTGFVFLFLFPEYAYEKLSESLDQLMRIALAFGRDVSAGRVTEGEIVATERRFSATLLQVLNLADQSRLEGVAGAAYSAAGTEAAAIVTRIAYRFEVIARERLGDFEATLPAGVRDRRARLDTAFFTAFESVLQRFEPGETPFVPVSPGTALPPIDSLNIALEELSVDAALEAVGRPPEVRRSLATQVESYRRLVTLLASLETEWSKIAAA